MIGDWEIIEMQLDSRVIRLLSYKQMCIIKTQKSEKLTNFKAETKSRSNVEQRILECKCPSFSDILIQHFWISNIFEYYYCEANIPNLSLWYIRPSASVQTCKPMLLATRRC